MGTEIKITLPDEVPVMTLPNVAFFPQALLPLRIFEPRYQEMLVDVLATDRLFAVAGLSSGRASGEAQSEPPHRIAGVGMVRACQKNDNGSSNLLLQGLTRVEITEIVADDPYRRIRIRPLASEPGAPTGENERLRDELSRLLALKLRLAAETAGELTTFLKTVVDPETFVDIAAFNLCESASLRQKLLETLDVHRRLQIFSRRVRVEIGALRLRRKLQTGLSEDRIGEN